ncbi:TPA: type 1 fimbrial protein [Proteus mirabilis]|nr:type 1 fimbrial protein [Proteus mirabilis]
MDFKMKKSLFSLLILSTLSLSTQAIAQEVKIGGTHNINVTGRVIQEALTCNVQPVAPIQLQDAYIGSFERTPMKNFSINFSGCTNQLRDRNVKVVISKKNTGHLANAGSTVNDTNARVILLDHSGNVVKLNGSDIERTFVSNVVGENGRLEFSLRYVQPSLLSGVLKPGNFNASLSFDAFVADDIH